MAAAGSSRAAGTDPFADHHLVEQAIRGLTIKSLKALIGDINRGLLHNDRHYLRLSGNKPELINRVIGVCSEKRAAKDEASYQRLRALIIENGGWIPNAGQASNPVRPVQSYAGAGPSLEKLNGSSHTGFSPAAASPLTTATARSVAGATAQARINFKPSPFWEIKQFVSSMVHCPEAPTSTDRKNTPVYVAFSAEQIAMLKQPNNKCQVRLFCTTHEAFAVSLSGRFPAPVEFPLTCEARVNGTQLSTNLRGSKKNAGRVPPPNLNKDNQLILVPTRQNRIELTYTNSPKKHVLIVAICEITSAETLVERLRQKAYRSKEEVLSSMKKAAEDDDIQAGSATMSLKCPLSYMRMTTPCRSSHCPHVQCFDALSFYSVNEQSPSWSCPVCNQIVKPEDILMDGYVDDIIKRVPDDHDSVIVEPDGSWRTPDGKITSDGYKAETASAPGTSRPTASAEPRSGDNGDSKQDVAAWASRTGPSSDDIVILDSPSPPAAAPPAPVARLAGGDLSTPSHASSPAGNSRQSSSRPAPQPAVIDLTLSDSEEEPSLPPPGPRPLPTAPTQAHGQASSLSSSSGMRAPLANGRFAHPAHPSAARPEGRPVNGTGSSSYASAAGPAGQQRRSSLNGQHASAQAGRPDDARDAQGEEDDDFVRRPGKRARMEAAQGGSAGPGSGRLARGNGIADDDSPAPVSAAGAAEMGGGPFARPTSSSSQHRPSSASGAQQRQSLPNSISNARHESGGPAQQARRLSDRAGARPAYPVSYLDTDIRPEYNGASSPLDAHHSANGGARGERGEMDWGDEADGSERGYTGVGRDTYFADDDWW